VEEKMMGRKITLFSISNKKGFTLVELLMVIAILGVLASIAIKMVSEERMKANDAQTITFMRNLLTRAETDLPTVWGLVNGGTNPPDYPELTLNPGMSLLIDYDSDGEKRWDFYLAHEGGKLGFYFWLPSDECTYDLKPPAAPDPAIPSDKLVPAFDTQSNYDFPGYRAMVGL
jgi:prepilin-type N-terminal cleavage/methylation domain-containing protein